jgi:hypothetical protein
LGGQGAVIRIDPANGTQKSIAAGNLLTHPAGIAVDRAGQAGRLMARRYPRA